MFKFCSKFFNKYLPVTGDKQFVSIAYDFLEITFFLYYSIYLKVMKIFSVIDFLKK